MRLDRIYIKGLDVFAYHGVMPKEKRDGQRFVLDITLDCDLSRAGRTDRLEDTVDYTAVMDAAVQAMTENSYDLIERAASRTAEAILRAEEKVERVTLCLRKPEAPIDKIFDYVAVEITRERKDIV
ncbi:MAG TPA: dihydroneopterin aldolase [Firmicutes bacterium]|nr:dihydroneopterin aldolase [Bacillota bacterium]